MFDADVSRDAKRLKPQQIGGTGDPARAISELHKLIAATLTRAGLL
jgi:hypothetical protein